MGATNWLLKSSTLWTILGVSGGLSLLILLHGLPELHKQEQELREAKVSLIQLNHRNQDLYAEVLRLAKKDPELMEALARRQGYARPGETVYTFQNKGERR